MRAEVARPPEFLVIPVRHELVPDLDFAFDKPLVGAGERAHVEKKIVAIRRFEIKTLDLLARRLFELLAEPGEKSERVRQVERAVVVEVVADEPIRDRRL